MELARRQVPKDIIWGIVRDQSKFAQRGRAYFDQSYGKAVGFVRDSALKCKNERREVEPIRSPITLALDEVEPKPIEWVWKGKFPRGKVTVISGDPGLGKSLGAIDIAARVSTGRAWPDCRDMTRSPGKVVILSAEDDVSDTIVPRLIAARADLSSITALQGIRTTDPETGSERETPFCLTRDLPQLEEVITQNADVDLVVLDPISAYLGSTDSHKNAEVRAALAPLSNLAAEHSVAVLCISHLNKGGSGSALYRTMGSLAFVAAARAVWVFSKDRNDPSRRLMLPAKNNLAADSEGLAYRIADNGQGVPVIEWEEGPVTTTADEALSEEKGRDSTERDEATEFLRQALSGGPMLARDVKNAARGEGISARTLQRARADLRIEPVRLGFGGSMQTYWRLPGDTIDMAFCVAEPTR